MSVATSDHADGRLPLHPAKVSFPVMNLANFAALVSVFVRRSISALRTARRGQPAQRYGLVGKDCGGGSLIVSLGSLSEIANQHDVATFCATHERDCFSIARKIENADAIVGKFGQLLRRATVD